MKFALVNGNQQEAEPTLTGECIGCGSPMVAKCGEVKIWHWAHHGRRHCDPWWENETEWHRAWKNQFPVEWQEVRALSEDGEMHIADVKTANEWVIEFQHSLIDSEERGARNAFYRKLVWVVDGTRRKTDAASFNRALAGEVPIGNREMPIFKVGYADECRLLREWSGSLVPVFFDFMGVDSSMDSRLWCLLPGSAINGAYVLPCSRKSFVSLHLSNEAQVGIQFDEFVDSLRLLVSDHLSLLSRSRHFHVPVSGRRHMVRHRGRL